MKNKNETWLHVDEPDGDPLFRVIIGNQLGIEKLRDALNETLIDRETEKTILLADSNPYIMAVTLQSKSNHLSGIKESKETFLDKIFGYLLFIWFIVLPIASIVLIVNLLFFSSPNDSTEKSPIKIEEFKRL